MANFYSSVRPPSMLRTLVRTWRLRDDSLRVEGIQQRQTLLTFDDGPHPINTPALLDELKQAGILATFFVVGKNLETPSGMKLIQRAVAEGHQIGNHTYSHRHLTTLKADQIREEILTTEKLIGTANNGLKLLRPPYGAHNSLVQQVAQDLGYNLFFWNVDTLDWHPSYKKGRWVNHAMEQIMIQEQIILLAHDIHATTVNKVGKLIAHIKTLSNGTFVQYS
jgi:peptidoglycan-N-acetylglucosamine deacetylase